MAAETSSTLTSTSHTLTGLPLMAPATTNPLAMASGGSSANDVLALLASLRPENRHAFLQPSAAMPTDSLRVVKDTLEGFAAQVGDEQQETRRRRERESGGRKRKRREDEADMLKVRKVYVDGFETAQVWQQAKRIIGGVLRYSEAALGEMEEKNELLMNGVHDESEEPDGSEIEVDSAEEDAQDDDSELLEEEDEDEAELSDDQVQDGDLENALEDDEDFDRDEDEDEDEDDGLEDPQEEYVGDPNNLNDGFFNIDEFNRQSQWFEDQDAKGDPNTDLASDDEEIDWDADPMAPAKSGPKASKGKAADDEPLSDGDGDDDDEEDGPTFGDMALDAPEGASEDEDMDEDEDADGLDFGNANEVYYKDFFAPPSKKSKDGKPKKGVRFQPKQPNAADVERAMADVRRDLFDDESDNDDSEDALSDVSAGNPKSRRSAHERRQAKLAEEIRKLEATSIAKREWTLSGEAAAVDRPMNSLLAEDLDFEHVGKPVPVITPEVTEGIEDLIKRRILAQEFDEVIRRRPDAEGVPTGTRRGMIELDDSKAEKSLAELYEEEHVKKTDPDAYVSKSDEKLQREEKEIEAMWKEVSGRLDALSSWHYKPKPAAPSLSVVADVATVSMEDAQPTTAQGVAGGASSSLAPQEVYKAGRETAAKGEVVPTSGLPMARQEMSREDRTRRRRREKERIRKAGGVDGNKPISGRAKMQRDTMAELKKGGVKVINRKGEITDVEGNKAKKAKAVTSWSYKL